MTSSNIKTWLGIGILGMTVLAAAADLAAQEHDERIAAVRKLYAQVQERIALADREARTGSAPGFYSNEIIINSRNGSWRAVGNYWRKTTYWYTDQPEFVRAEGEPEESALVKAEVDEKAAVATEHWEYLFDKGRLVFAFHKRKAGQEAPEEMRWYFFEGALISYMIGTKMGSEKCDIGPILKQAAARQREFLAQF
jgi:hypothetical protein